MEIEFHELAEDFRPQLMRALKWGVPPENGPVKLISGKVCSGFLRVHYSLQQILPIKEEDCLIESRNLNDATLIQEMLRELARIPLLQLEAKGVCEVWERVRAARQGKGGNLIVHGLTDGIVELVEAGGAFRQMRAFFLPLHATRRAG